MIMKFLSESGLTYFLNKLKNVFVSNTDFNKTTKVVNKVAKQTIDKPKVCVRKAININSVNDNIWYFHQHFDDGPVSLIPIKLTSNGYYRIKIICDDFVDTLNGNKTYNHVNTNIEYVDNNVFKYSITNDDNKDIIPFSNIIYFENSYTFSVYKVESVVNVVENGIKIQEVTLRGANMFNCNTLSPYFCIGGDEKIQPIKVKNKLPIKHQNKIIYYRNRNNERIYVYCYKHKVYKRRTRKVFMLSNRMRRDGTGGNIRSGIAVLKYYHKGIFLNSRTVSIKRNAKDKTYTIQA